MSKPRPIKSAGKKKAAIAELLLSFHRLRVLHHLGVQPMSASVLLMRLGGSSNWIEPQTLDSMLSQLKRAGWLKSVRQPAGNGFDHPTYSLTLKGRRVLNFALQKLSQLMATWPSFTTASRKARAPT